MLRSIWIRFVLRPLGRLLRIDRWEPWLVYEGRCTACGDEAVCMIPADTPCLDRESGHIFGAQCGACGEMSCTSI